MTGKLYGVGIGPGDPELITIKAQRILNAADVVAVPKTAAEKGSQAMNIAGALIGSGKELLPLLFPMSFDGDLLEKSREQAASQIRKKLDEGRDVAFITLGDPTVYSTYMYIHKQLRGEGYDAEIIPGVTSFCASAASAGISLGENRETIAVIPSAYEAKDLKDILRFFDSIVLMKVSKNLPQLAEMLKSERLLDKSVLVSRCGMENERIEYDWESMMNEKVSYFSSIIIKKGGVR